MVPTMTFTVDDIVVAVAIALVWQLAMSLPPWGSVKTCQTQISACVIGANSLLSGLPR